MPKTIFIIGPGGAGKSTAGVLLARLLSCNFLDLDTVFCERVKTVGKFIKEFGYESYCQHNSNLFFQLIKELTKPTVFVLSSGFLAYSDEDMVKSHLNKIKEGISIRLLPFGSKEEVIKQIIQRQLSRGLSLSYQKEIDKINIRYDIYSSLGDIKINSSQDPQDVARTMLDELRVFSSNPYSLM